MVMVVGTCAILGLVSAIHANGFNSCLQVIEVTSMDTDDSRIILLFKMLVWTLVLSLIAGVGFTVMVWVIWTFLSRS